MHNTASVFWCRFASIIAKIYRSSEFIRQRVYWSIFGAYFPMSNHTMIEEGSIAELAFNKTFIIVFLRGLYIVYFCLIPFDIVII